MEEKEREEEEQDEKEREDETEKEQEEQEEEEQKGQLSQLVVPSKPGHKPAQRGPVRCAGAPQATGYFSGRRAGASAPLGLLSPGVPCECFCADCVCLWRGLFL